MDKDLEQLQNEILAKENPSSNKAPIKVESTPAIETPLVDFTPIENIQPVSSIQKSSDEVGEVVTQIFKGAVVSTVQNDDGVKQDILDTAKTVITNKTEALKSQAEKESKEAYFDNNEAACQYFGYDERTTSKAHVKIMAFWAFILNTIYIFTIGFFVIAPITFICKKIKVVIKTAWVAVLLAILIYAAVIGLPILFSWLGSL